MSVLSSFKKSAFVIMGCFSNHSCTGHYANDLNSRQQNKDPLVTSIGSELGPRRVFLRRIDVHTLHINFCMISLSVMSSYVVGTELQFFFGATAPSPPPVGHGLLMHEVSRSQTTMNHSQ